MNIKKIKYLILFLLVPVLMFASLIEMKNKFIKVIADTETARFILKTTGGDPNLDSDQDSLLLYEDYPPTSFTTVQVDGREYKFGSDENGMFTTRLMKRNDMITTVWNIRNIDVRQTLKIVKGPTTGNLDTLEIIYDVVNRDNKPHEVGVRVMLDTYLGKEDGAPYRIPQKGNITEEKMLKGSELPEYWYSYDDLSKPTVIAQGSLKIEGSPDPDKIIFASWERFNKYLWDFTIKPGRSFRRSIIGPLDSALAMYWPIGKLEPNNNYILRTYYGLMSREVIKPVESKIEQPKIVQKKKTYTIVDFSEINRILGEMNKIQGLNNSKLDEINKLLEKKRQAIYKKIQRETDRKGIKQRKETAEGLEEQVPAAVESAIKDEKR